MPVTESFRMRQRGKRVGGFARLRDHDHQRFGIGNAVAIAVLAGDLRLRRDAGHAFQPRACDHACVVARPASKQAHRVDVREHLRGGGTEQ